MIHTFLFKPKILNIKLYLNRKKAKSIKKHYFKIRLKFYIIINN